MSTPIMQNAQRQLDMYNEGFVHGVYRLIEIANPEMTREQVKQAVTDALTRMELWNDLNPYVEDLFPDIAEEP